MYYMCVCGLIQNVHIGTFELTFISTVHTLIR